MEKAFEIVTPEGTMHGKPGDWLVRGTAGEFYPVQDSIFREIYTDSEGMPVGD